MIKDPLTELAEGINRIANVLERFADATIKGEYDPSLELPTIYVRIGGLDDGEPIDLALCTPKYYHPVKIQQVPSDHNGK